MKVLSAHLQYMPSEFEGEELNQITAKITFVSVETNSEITFSKDYNENAILNKTFNDILDNLKNDYKQTLRHASF